MAFDIKQARNIKNYRYVGDVSLVKSQNLVFSVEDILKKQTNKTGIKTIVIFLGFKIFKQVNKQNKK